VHEIGRRGGDGTRENVGVPTWRGNEWGCQNARLWEGRLCRAGVECVSKAEEEVTGDSTGKDIRMPAWGAGRGEVREEGVLGEV
jgi:hypothetical protein